MKNFSLLISAALALTALALAGCGAGPTSIPVGQWAGQGTYVDYEAVIDSAHPAAPVTRAKDHLYRTTLQISKATLFGREALVLAIDSKRGPLFNVGGDETKGKFGLVKLRDNGRTLYAVINEETMNSPAAKATAVSPLPPNTIAWASAVPGPDGLVLQIDYVQPGKPPFYEDTFQFQADRIIKTGTYATVETKGSQQKTVVVRWVEQLRPARLPGP